MYSCRGAFTCQGRSRRRGFIFTATCRKLFREVRGGEDAPPASWQRTHTHKHAACVMTCISYEMLCIGHLVDLTPFLRRHHHPCALSLPPQPFFCTWKTFAFFFNCLLFILLHLRHTSATLHPSTHTHTHGYSLLS